VLRPGGRIAFYTIHASPGLPEREYQRVLRVRSPGLGTFRRDHSDLLASAGFALVLETDVTAEFLRIAKGWLEGRERYSDQLRAVEGEAEFAAGQAERQRSVEAIAEGLLRRSLFVAEKGR